MFMQLQVPNLRSFHAIQQRDAALLPWMRIHHQLQASGVMTKLYAFLQIFSYLSEAIENLNGYSTEATIHIFETIWQTIVFSS